MSVNNIHSFCRFWPVSWTVTLFWRPGVITMINEHRGAFMCQFEHSHFGPILTHFVDYYSSFWGPKAISIVVEPQGALTCRSSTIAVWANFGSFLGLLLSFGGPGVISTIYKPRGAFRFRSSTHNFGRFWSVSCTITHRFGVPGRFP